MTYQEWLENIKLLHSCGTNLQTLELLEQQEPNNNIEEMLTPKLEELIITSQEISNKYKKTVLHGRELLITVRANIGDTCVIGEEFKGCNVGRGIVPIRTNENIISLDFLKQQFDTTEMNRLVKSLAKGITLIQLNMEDLRKIKLIVPPISLQNQFATFVQQIDKSKFAVQKSLEKAETLYKSLMQEYFG